MLLIGSRDGFTLLEVMVATAILSFGILLIYQAFFTTLDAFNYYSNYLNLAPWIGEKVWEAQDELVRLGPRAQLAKSGGFRRRNKDCKWSLSYSAIDRSTDRDLYRVNVMLSWLEGKKRIELKRIGLAIHEKEDITIY
ncbi:MAG: prepilin-type N-terminal cleavage/methylation domain-containing protein [Candidatus Omnitrophota bacterium]